MALPTDPGHPTVIVPISGTLLHRMLTPLPEKLPIFLMTKENGLCQPHRGEVKIITAQITSEV
jgi:hypothetical protein